MGLIQLGSFTFNSGRKSPIKFECDSLTDDDIAGLAFMCAHQVAHFSEIIPVLKGKSDSPIDNAKRLADALEKYRKTDWDGCRLIVDDVWTTGGSMEACRKSLPRAPAYTIGWVAIAYGIPPTWITPGLLASPMHGVWT